MERSEGKWRGERSGDHRKRPNNNTTVAYMYILQICLHSLLIHWDAKLEEAVNQEKEKEKEKGKENKRKEKKRKDEGGRDTDPICLFSGAPPQRFSDIRIPM